MIVWRITGNEIGPNSCGAHYFTTKAEAERARKDCPGDAPLPEPAERIEIKSRKDLVNALHDAMGYGCS